MLGLLSTKFELIQKSLILLDLVTVYNGKYRKVFFFQVQDLESRFL